MEREAISVTEVTVTKAVIPVMLLGRDLEIEAVRYCERVNVEWVNFIKNLE